MTTVAAEDRLDPAALGLLVALGLSPRQAEVYLFLFESTRTTGVQPSIREVCQRFGTTSVNGPLGHLAALARKGWIRPCEGEARSIRFLRRPDGAEFTGFVLPEDRA
jgi:SOS-response transcriptional repressor LexA